MIYRSAPSDVRPLLRLVSSSGSVDREVVVGADVLPAGDHRVVLWRAGGPEITATAASELVEAVRIVIDPLQLANSGPKLGVGLESAQLSWHEEPTFDIEIRWHSAHRADPFARAAQAARERLRLAFDLVAMLERGSSRLVLGELPWLAEVAQARRPKPAIPISTTNEHGQLAVRFRVTPGYRPTAGASGTWYKLYDTGVIERPRDADTDDDGAPDGAGRITEDRVRAITALAMKPLSLRGDDVDFEWQVYDALGKRIAEHRCSVDSEMGGPGPSAAPLIYELSGLTYVCR